MGKVHRIKRAFQKKIASQHPIQPGTYSLGKVVSVDIGISWGGKPYAITWWGHSYNKLVEKLMREYNERAV